MILTVGIDPDSKAHGVAIYKGSNLVELHEWPRAEIISWVLGLGEGAQCRFSIEDMKANKCVFRQHSHKKARPQGEIGRKLGLCQQAQIELERDLLHLGIPFELHKPQSGNWAKTKMKPQFKLVTGWKKRSNADTRSAAFFGFLSLNNRQGFTPLHNLII